MILQMTCQFEKNVLYLNISLKYYFQTARMAEGLRRWTQVSIDNVCVGSNPTPGILMYTLFFDRLN